MPPSAYMSHRVGPGLPCLVWNWTTPLAASVPKSTLDDGPPATCTDSRSLGLRSLMRDGVWPPTPTDEEAEPLSTRTPSRYSTGSLESERLLEPRMRMRVPLPVVPPASCTVTPGILALSRSAISVGAALDVMSAASAR